MWSWLTGLFGAYRGTQRRSPYVPIAEHTQPVTIQSALQIPAVWECVNKITRSMSGLPIDVLEVIDRDGNTRRDETGRLYRLLNVSPNAFQTPADFLKRITVDYLTEGNAFIRMEKARGADYTAALTPLPPGQVQVNNTPEGVRYVYLSEDGEPITYTSADVMHWKGIGNNLVGMSLIHFAGTSLTEAASAQNASIELFRNKGKISGILSSESPILNQKQMKDFIESFTAMKNADVGVPLLPQGFKFQQLGLSPVDTQLLQTREFIVKEFARWFGIPYGLLTGEASELVDLSNYFYETVIMPMCTELEQVLTRGLVKSDKIRLKFRTSVLKRMSDTTKIQMQTSYAQNGLRTRNELRREDGLERMDGADQLTAQNNLYPVEKLGESDATQTPQTPLTDQPVKQ